MFKSFTFRVGFLFFLAVASILVGFRLISFQQLISTTEDDIASVIMAHTREVERGVERDGPRYAVYLIEALTQQSDDPHLVLALQSGEVLHGNLRAWPEDVLQSEPGWQEATVALTNRQGIVKARIFTTDLVSGQRLIVGYDLIRITQIKRALVASLIQNIWISVFASLGLTFILLYSISSYLEKINGAYRQVMAGDISFRIANNGANDVFSRLSQNFNKMMDWVSSLITTLKESTNGLAHDLRTPLARTRLRLQQIEQQLEADDPKRDAIVECIDDIDHLTGIFNNILSIAKAEDLSVARQFTSIDVAEMLRDLGEYYEAYLESANQSIKLEIAEESLKVKGERQLLSQAVINLIGNASKYSPENEAITVTARKSPRYKGLIEIIVADRGPGIPAEYRDKVKERFFRLDESRNTPGTGLGLNLADAAIRLHRGSLVLEDNAPGLRALIILPEEH